MKKIFILFLIFLFACGPSDDEIQAEIDQAVNKALQEATSTTVTTTSTTSTTTSTLPTTTTTTVDLVSICRENVVTIKGFALDFFTVHDENYLPFWREIVDATPENASRFNWEDENVQKKWIALQIQVDKIKQKEEGLPTPKINTLYDDYYFTVNEMTKYFYEIIFDWELIEFGYDDVIKYEDINKNYNFLEQWVDEYYKLPNCSTTNY